MLRRAARTLAVALLGALVLGVPLAWRAALRPAAADGAARSFTVTPGESLAAVARDLEAQGLVRNAGALVWLARLRGEQGALRAGEYELSPALGTREILQRLTAGHVKTYRVVLPEGLRAREIAARLSDAGLVDREAFLREVADPERARELGVEGPTLEGYLFPETYRLQRGLEAAEVCRVLVSHFLAVWKDLAADAEAHGLSMRETVTLASIVEKETAAPQERSLIAAVFLNRLARGMRLESDPTVIYGIENFDGNLKRVHLDDASNPYNTYRIHGLPPTPIANPGRAALEAVLHPAEADYLFFVSRNDGTHVFSKSYREHRAAVNRFQRRRRR